MSENSLLTAGQIKEFAEAMQKFHEDRDDSQLQTLFALFDRDGSGKISRTELKTTMDSVAMDFTDEELSEMLEEGDTNKDGSIDPEEFLAVMRKQRDSE